jgi:hypothetical protein
MKIFMFVAIVLSFQQGLAQGFAIKDGEWKGTMRIYKSNAIIDTLPVTLTLRTIIKDSVWQWKTTYLSSKMPLTKDYLLKVKDREKGVYITDEQDGTELLNYLMGNKMYCQFEVSDIFLTSSYEWIQDDIKFEITAGKKLASQKEISNYSVNTLQTVLFKKVL